MKKRIAAEVDVLHITTDDGQEPLYLCQHAGTVSTQDESHVATISTLPDGSMLLRMKHGDRRKTYIVRTEDVFRAIVESEDMKS